MAELVAPPIETVSSNSRYVEFPYTDSKDRIKNYDYYEKLFLGDHFNAFNIRIDDQRYNREYQKLRYVIVNFAGAISKVVADLLFSEPIIIKSEKNQEFLENLVEENNLEAQFYESALSNSFLGDDVFKIRVGLRRPSDKKPSLIIEENTPKVYFPHLNKDNVRDEPTKHEFAWKVIIDEKEYLRKEIHEVGKITNELWTLKNGAIQDPVDIKEIMGIEETEDTKVDRMLVTHIPNWKIAGKFFGISDYFDLDSLFYAINNRFTKVDNVLDKHTDPILAVPEGVLDEDGKVRREALNMIEISPEAGKEKPAYVVWDASLENAFSELERLVESLFIVSETSPDVFGQGKGQSDSGRALKLKILRTIAKASRKRLYYDRAIKDILYTAQFVAKAWNLEAGGVKCSEEPTMPDIEWNNGLPIDDAEAIDDEVKRQDAGLSTVEDALMRLDGMDEHQAKEKAKEIKEAKKISMPAMNMSNNPFAKKQDENTKELNQGNAQGGADVKGNNK